MSCKFCDEELYVKTIQYTSPLLAPLTEVEALRQRLIDKTGEVYLRLSNNFCCMCGQALNQTQKEGKEG